MVKTVLLESKTKKMNINIKKFKEYHSSLTSYNNSSFEKIYNIYQCMLAHTNIRNDNIYNSVKKLDDCKNMKERCDNAYELILKYLNSRDLYVSGFEAQLNDLEKYIDGLDLKNK